MTAFDWWGLGVMSAILAFQAGRWYSRLDAGQQEGGPQDG